MVGQTPDGSNLQSLYNFPNCESTCDYEADQSDFADLLDSFQDQVWPGGYAIGEIFATKVNSYDSGTELIVYPASCSDIDNVATCTIDDSGFGESGWDLLYVNVWGYFFGEAMTQYNYILSIPDTTTPGEQYVVVFEELSGSGSANSFAYEVGADPSAFYFDRPSGSELSDYGLPNCELPDCTYYSDYSDFDNLNLVDDLTPDGEFYGYIEITDWYDDATVASGGVDISIIAVDLNGDSLDLDFSDFTITAASLDVYLTSDGSDIDSLYYDFHMKIPETWTQEMFFRISAEATTDSGSDVVYFPDASGYLYLSIPTPAEFTGGGNSGSVDYVESEDAFFEQIGENCFEIVNTWLNVDFTASDSTQEGGVAYRRIDDYIAVQVTMDPDETWSSGDMAGGTMLKDVGW